MFFSIYNMVCAREGKASNQFLTIAAILLSRFFNAMS